MAVPSFSALLLSALLLSLSLTASAGPVPVPGSTQLPEDQSLLYDLYMSDKRIGTREVTIRHMETAAGTPVRLIESYQELEVQVAGVVWTYANRASARVEASRSSFTSSVKENGSVREVQARQRRDGAWKVTIVEEGDVKQASLPQGQVDLSSLQLLDPIGHRELTARPRASVLAAETGTLLSGVVEDLGEGVIDLSGEIVAVHSWSWSPGPGRFELSWSMDGVLVAYDTAVMGKTLSARLRQAPVARSFGQLDSLAPVIGNVTEQEL